MKNKRRKYHTQLSRVGTKCINAIRDAYFEAAKGHTHDFIWRFPRSTAIQISRKYKVTLAVIHKAIELAHGGEL